MNFDRMMMIEALRRVIHRMHCPLEVMLVCVRWYAAYPLSFRNIEEVMTERGNESKKELNFVNCVT